MKPNRAILLMSGGIDSPVAGNYLKENNIEIISVHFCGEPYTNETPNEKSKKLSKLIDAKKYIKIDFGEVQAEIVKRCNHRLYYVLTRRIMLKISEKLAEKYDAQIIVTGDNLGQVSSQTLKNMATISKATKIPIIKPLLTMDKQEIIDKSKEIELYEISKGPEMCSVLGPKNPKTRSNVKEVEREEEKLNIDKIIKDAIDNLEEVII